MQMNNLDQQTSELWQTYTTKNTDEQFWENYDKLRQTAGKNYQSTVIQQARMLKKKRTFASTLTIAADLEAKLGEMLEHKRPGFAPIVLGGLGMLLPLPLFMLDSAAIVLLVFLSGTLFAGSLTVLVKGIKNYRRYAKLKKILGTVLEVDDEYISGVSKEGEVEAIRFTEITTIGTEDFGLVLRTRGKDKHEKNALIVPFAIEQFDKLKEYLYQQVRKNNKFVPEHQNLNVLRV